MSEPSTKRRRTAPCPCPACNFQVRDERTVASHVERLYQSCTNMFNSFVSSPNVLPPSDPVTVEQDDWLASTVDSTCASTCMPESPSTTLKIPGDKIQEYVMKEVKLKLGSGHSVADIEGHLNNTASLVGGDQIPTTWSGVLKMMKQLGYANPRHLKICAARDHSFLLKSNEENPVCGICGKRWHDCIDYYCLGLNFQDWCATEERCHKLMSHWDARQEWFDKPDGFKPELLPELGHGQRFRQLSSFWNNTEEYLLPLRCPECTKIVSVDVLNNALENYHHSGTIQRSTYCH